MPAFEAVSAKRRAQLAQLTNGDLRMVGGSADTLYLPGYLREPFLETLDLFLDTDCFLEIAVPTAVHLVRPSSQKISFVDHVSLPGSHFGFPKLIFLSSGGYGRSPSTPHLYGINGRTGMKWILFTNISLEARMSKVIFRAILAI
jgi:hypothetical protein